jgi:hypothetical protein
MVQTGRQILFCADRKVRFGYGSDMQVVSGHLFLLQKAEYEEANRCNATDSGFYFR